MKDYFNNIAKNANTASSWVIANEDVENELKNESNELVTDLCRLANNANAIADVYTNNNTIGVFGASQVGKSYLVSSIAADNRRLKTTIDGEEIDFIKIINPNGMDKEATAVVTRFTHKTDIKCPKGYPIAVKVFKEVEVVMCLVNTYFQDFEDTKQENPEDDLFKNETVLFKALDDIYNNNDYVLKQGDTSQVSMADVVLLADYVKKTSKGILRDYEATSKFWNVLRTYLPKLNLEGRKKIYSYFWGRIKAFDTLFNVIISEYEKLCGALVVYVPIQAFAKKNKATGEYVQNLFTINYVKSFDHLFTHDLEDIEIALDNEGQKKVEVNIAPMAFLSMELLFPLQSASKLEDFDIVDFPGARSREYGSLSLYKSNDSYITNDTVPDSIRSSLEMSARRGKISYLFDRYNTRHEFDMMLFCVRSSTQPEVKGVGPLVNGWVSENIGGTPEQRAAFSKVPLLGVITRFDECICKGLDSQTGQNGARGIINDALSEFKVHSWLTNWSNGKHFNQFFMARRPNLPCNDKWLEMNEDRTEIGVKSSLSSYIAEFKEDFLSDPETKYLRDAARCFEESLSVNDGGASYLINYICDNFGDSSLIESRQRKLDKVKDRVKSLRDKLSKYASLDGEAKLQEIKNTAQRIKNGLMQCHEVSKLIYDIREKLALSTKELSELYIAKYRKSAENFAEDVKKAWENNLDSMYLGYHFSELFSILERDWNKEVLNKSFSQAKEYSFFFDETNNLFLTTDKDLVKDAPDRLVYDAKGILKERFSKLLRSFVDELKTAARSEAISLTKTLSQKLSETEYSDALNEDFRDRRVALIGRILADYNYYLTTHIYNEYNKNNGKQSTKSDPFGYQITQIEFGLPKIDEPDINESKIDNGDSKKQSFINNYDQRYLDSYFTNLENLMIDVNSKQDSKYKFSNAANAELCGILSNLKCTKD